MPYSDSGDWPEEAQPLSRRRSRWRVRAALRLLLDQQDSAYLLLERLNRKVNKIMATQEEINTYVQEINGAVDGLVGDFERFAAEHPDIDTSGLRGAVDRLKALDAERPAPEPEPTPEG